MARKRRKLIPFGTQYGNRPKIRNGKKGESSVGKPPLPSRNQPNKGQSETKLIPLKGKENETHYHHRQSKKSNPVNLRRRESEETTAHHGIPTSKENRFISKVRVDQGLSDAVTPRIRNLAREQNCDSRFDGKDAQTGSSYSKSRDAHELNTCTRSAQKSRSSQSSRYSRKIEKNEPIQPCREGSIDNKEVMAAMMANSRDDQSTGTATVFTYEGKVIGDSYCESADESEITMNAFPKNNARKNQEVVNNNAKEAQDRISTGGENVQAQLPPGWFIKYSRSKNNRPYYCHAKYGTTWDHPSKHNQISHDSSPKHANESSMQESNTTKNLISGVKRNLFNSTASIPSKANIDENSDERNRKNGKTKSVPRKKIGGQNVNNRIAATSHQEYEQTTEGRSNKTKQDRQKNKKASHELICSLQMLYNA